MYPDVNTLNNVNVDDSDLIGYASFDAMDGTEDIGSDKKKLPKKMGMPVNKKTGNPKAKPGMGQAMPGQKGAGMCNDLAIDPNDEISIIVPEGNSNIAEDKKLTAKARKHIKGSNFALPGRRYPINDPNHARAALSMVARHGTPAEKAAVRRKVHAKYPNIGKGSKSKGGKK